MFYNKRILWLAAAFLFSLSVNAIAQADQSRSCQFAGAYRVDPNESDPLYSIVRDATSRVPFGEQQQFFIDLSTRLTPPDMLAIECRGKHVSVGSSRARKLTFLADGISRQETRRGGTRVNARVTMSRDTLIFTSSGTGDDSVNVAFQSIDSGRRLRVTRRIAAAQLNEPIIIKTIYDRMSERVNWDTFEEPLLARQSTHPPDAVRINDRHVYSSTGRGEQAETLRRSLDDWIEATNERDIERQMTYYMPRLQAYYLTRNTPRDLVRREKNRVFSTARSIDIRAEEPEIIFQDGGRLAVMRFRKQYKVVDRSKTKSGEVVQELRWQQLNGQWRITSERDIRVIR